MRTDSKFRCLRKFSCSLFLFMSMFYFKCSYGQGSGYIIRPATGTTGPSVLDPNTTYNAPNYTSKTTEGFKGDDVTNSELPFKSIRAFSLEPNGDLRRGPNHLFSDFVPDDSGNGYYSYFDGSNLIFRFRMGSIIPGAKGYSVLIDTDGKFGGTGTNADPNYIAATNGTNGNPGFEIEIVLETGSRLAIYNVDGKSSPVLATPIAKQSAYQNWTDFSQVSIAGTNDNGDPDILLDFFVPWSDLATAFPSLTNATSLRMVATTVMSPQPAIGGPKSDIYGISDTNYPLANDAYTAFINAQSPFTVSNLSGTSTSSVGTLCTAAPVITTVNVGTSANGRVQGTWTKSLPGASNSAIVEVFKSGNISLGTTSATSGGIWTLSGITINNGDVITAKATGNGETNTCYTSNSITAISCASPPVQPTGFCGAKQGFTGTNLPSGATVNIYRLVYAASGNGWTLLKSAVPVTPTGGPGQQGGVMGISGSGWTYDGGCSNGGGNNDGGTYMVFFTVGGCNSKPAFVCASNTAGSYSTLATPVGALAINNTSSIYPTTNTITGVATANTIVRVYVDGWYSGTASLTGTTWTYTFPNSLSSGQTITVNQQLADNTSSKIYYCLSSDIQTTVQSLPCSNTPPVINVNSNSKLANGSPISGYSSAPQGSTVKVYTSANSLVATTTVQINGTWSTGNAGTLPSTYNASYPLSYYATIMTSACATESTPSSTFATVVTTSSSRCGTLTGAVSGNINNGSIISTSETNLSGTLSSTVADGTIINVYEDGGLIGSAITITGTNNWGPISVSGKLYGGGVITVGVQNAGTDAEYICSSFSCSCTAPTQPIVTPESSSISSGGTQTYVITNPVSGVFYGIADATTGQSLATGVWATSTSPFSLTTKPVSSTVSVVIKATSLSSTEMCSIQSTTRTLTVNQSVLPVHLIEFKGKRETASVLLNWIIASEENFSHYEIERSSNGANFYKIGDKAALHSTARASYSYKDIQPLQGVSYYRLRMVDIDGKYAFSNVIALSSNGTSISLNAIRPNPFYGDIAISLSLEKKQQVKFNLVDGSGRNIKSVSINGSIGLNEVDFSDLANLPTGIYMLVVTTQEGEIKQKLIKTK